MTGQQEDAPSCGTKRERVLYMGDGAEGAGYLIKCDRTLGMLLVQYCCKFSKVPGSPKSGNVEDKEFYYGLRLAVSVQDLEILRMLLDIIRVLYSSDRNCQKMRELECRMSGGVS